MQRYTEKIRVRLMPEEMEHLKKCFLKNEDAVFKSGRGNFSGFLRSVLLQNTNYKNLSLQKQLKELRYEFRKIGVNINQIAKKVNSGIGTPEDLKEAKNELKKLQEILHDYQKEVERVWESPN